MTYGIAPPPPAAPPAPATPNSGEMLQKYAELRKKIDSIKARHKAELEPYVTAESRLEGFILAYLQAQGLQSQSTTFGTVFLTRRDSFSVEDGEAYFNFCIQNGRTDLLERRAAKKAVEAYIEETGQLPPGVKKSSDLTIGYRSK